MLFNKDNVRVYVDENNILCFYNGEILQGIDNTEDNKEQVLKWAKDLTR